MLVREFLYVDTEKVRGLLAQMEGGIAEEIRSAINQSKKTGMGLKGVAEHGLTWGTEEQVSKSLGDALFPALEEVLESRNLITDVSEDLQDRNHWDTIRNDLAPGAVIRLTAPASLFDARYLAVIFAGLASTIRGFAGIAADPPGPGSRPGSSGSGKGKRPQAAQPKPRPMVSESASQLEDQIPDLPNLPGMADMPSSEQLRSFIRMARGMFTPGVHMLFRPTEDEDSVVSARLQEGRAYLDTDPDILFARYGLNPQEWTIVGSVGHYAEKEAPDFQFPDLVSGEILSRARMTGVMNGFLHLIGRMGLADLPQYPGFSVVPLGVYRTLGETVET